MDRFPSQLSPQLGCPQRPGIYVRLRKRARLLPDIDRAVHLSFGRPQAQCPSTHQARGQHKNASIAPHRKPDTSDIKSRRNTEIHWGDPLAKSPERTDPIRLNFSHGLLLVPGMVQLGEMDRIRAGVVRISCPQRTSRGALLTRFSGHRGKR